MASTRYPLVPPTKEQSTSPGTPHQRNLCIAWKCFISINMINKRQALWFLKKFNYNRMYSLVYTEQHDILNENDKLFTKVLMTLKITQILSFIFTRKVSSKLIFTNFKNRIVCKLKILKRGMDKINFDRKDISYYLILFAFSRLIKTYLWFPQ